MVSLAAQKFVTGIANDALELQKQKRTAPQQKLKDQGYNIKDKRHVLSMVEIAEALQEVSMRYRAIQYTLLICKPRFLLQHGIDAKQPTYYNDDSTTGK